MPAVPDVSLRHLLGRGAPRSPDRESLAAWGRAVGALLPRPAVVTLSGDLGAGKTTLARALCEGLGVEDLDEVTSPTFSLVQHYPTRGGVITHVDLYRLRSEAELLALGWDELMAAASVLLIEWPERAAATLPAEAIGISLTHDSQSVGRRVLRIHAPRLPSDAR